MMGQWIVRCITRYLLYHIVQFSLVTLAMPDFLFVVQTFCLLDLIVIFLSCVLEKVAYDAFKLA